MNSPLLSSIFISSMSTWQNILPCQLVFDHMWQNNPKICCPHHQNIFKKIFSCSFTHAHPLMLMFTCLWDIVVVFHGCQHMIFIFILMFHVFHVLHVIFIISTYHPWIFYHFICLITLLTTQKIQLLSSSQMVYLLQFVHLYEPPKPNPCQSHPS